MDDLSNSYLSGRDEYPKKVVDAYNLVTNWKAKKSGARIKLNDGVNFNTYGEGTHKGDVHVSKGVIQKMNGQPVK